MEQIIDEFHKHYYNSFVWSRSKWLGIPIIKNPLDLMIYQEIICEIHPDVIIECGTFNGGSALFFASIFDLLGKGKVISIDLAPQPGLPYHPRIQYIIASSTQPQTVEHVKGMLNTDDIVMVFLDSDHTKSNVMKELQMYHPMVTKESYLIVEDTNINGHPVLPGFGPGPYEAVLEFLQNNDQFVIDENRHKYFMTFNPQGFLRKIR